MTPSAAVAPAAETDAANATTDRLYRVYRHRVLAHCLRILRDPGAAEDALQETFLRVRRHAARAPEGSGAASWLGRIATNYCLNELRNRRRRPEPRDRLPEDPGRSDEERHAERDFARHLVGRAAPRVGRVAWLYHVDELDQIEVATAMRVSRRTVINWLAEFEDAAHRLAARLL